MTNEQNYSSYFTENQRFNNDKFVVYLNKLLAVENASLSRLQSRIQSTPIEEARQILEYHVEETKQQQDRLRHIITKFGGIATDEEAWPAFLTAPSSIQKELQKTMTLAETELQEIEMDTKLESAETISYNVLLQMAIKMSFDDNVKEAIPLLRQSLEEEEKMNGWLRAHLPTVFVRLWPEIVSPSSLTAEQAEIISNIKQTFTCELCDDAFFNSTEELKLHVIANHNQTNKSQTTKQ